MKGFKMNGTLALVIGVFFLFLLFYIATNIFSLIWRLSLFLMPIFLIVTFFINKDILINYGKWVGNVYKRNKTNGLVVGALSLLCSPLVSLFLFGKAMMFRKAKQMKQQYETKRDGEFIEYEEVDEGLELPRLDEIKQRPKVEIRQKPKSNNDSPYTDLFE